MYDPLIQQSPIGMNNKYIESTPKSKTLELLL